LPPVTPRRRVLLFARQEASISSGTLSVPMSPIFDLMTQFIRTWGDMSSQPLNIVTKP
jgi:hypothetical protein